MYGPPFWTRFWIPCWLGLFLCLGPSGDVPGQEPLPPQEPMVDPAVEPAQFLQPPLVRPGQPANGTVVSLPGAVAPAPPETGNELRMAGLPPQPPTPMVQIVVLVPQDLPPGKDMPCTIRVINSSAADAHKVRVRMPLPVGVQVIKQEPVGQSSGTEWNWDFKTLKPGESHSIVMTFKPEPTTKTIDVKAFASFEHGQAVRTRISSPRVKVKTEVPKQATNDEPIPVRVSILNEGRVPLVNVKLIEEISAGFDYHEETLGEPTKDNPRQRLWNVGTVQAGEQKLLTYRVVPKDGRSLLVTSTMQADGQEAIVDTGETKIVEAGIKVELRGDARTSGSESAIYEAVVTNSGSLPLVNVRVLGLIPPETRLVKKTEYGTEYRDGVAWTIPKLAPGEKRSFRWGLQANGGGRRSIRVTATARPGSTGPGMLVSNRPIESSDVVETVFQGTAVLRWETRFEQPTVILDRSALYTIRVRNDGTEPANQVKVTVDLPKELVLATEATPQGKIVGNQVVFEAVTLPPGRTETFTITFRGQQLGQAEFAAKLTADVLGDRPLSSLKSIAIVR